MERTPYYAQQLSKQLKLPKAKQAESSELFTFALDPDWKDKLDPHMLDRMRSIIADYEEAKRRCRAFRRMAPSGNYRKDVQRILFSRDQENEYSVDDLYHEFDRFSAYQIHVATENLRQSNWQFTPKKDREVTLFSIIDPFVPSLREFLCDFRCGGYRVLGDILMDLDAQFQDAKVKKHKGIRKDDTEQMKAMMSGAVDSQDYRQKLIQNCKGIIYPTIRQKSGEDPEQIPWDVAVKCAEALGKRDFILEVMPARALELAIDRNEPEQKKGGESFAERVGRLFGLHRVS